MTAGVPKLLDKPIVFALGTSIIALGVTAGVMLWGESSPERVLIGLQGRHDAPKKGGERLAACLDCHVPFVGTPGSRCLGPGCHGDLATGTPPRDGPAMPIRFHVALRDQPCGICHAEHVALGTRTSTRTFTHAIIPDEARGACSRCHSGARLPSHASTDSVACPLCHGTKSWHEVEVDHAKLQGQPCDLCHRAPADTAHASIAGNCTECHDAGSWKKRAPDPPR